jgi:hypothetical protein
MPYKFKAIQMMKLSKTIFPKFPTMISQQTNRLCHSNLSNLTDS